MDKALVYETTDVGFDPQRGRLRSSGMRIAASRLAQWLRALAVVGSWDRFLVQNPGPYKAAVTVVSPF